MEQEAERAQPARAAIVLAGGEITRLRSLIRRITGRDVPKQCCPLIGRDTLLEQTLRRASLSVEKRMTSVAVRRIHERFYAPLTQDIPAPNLIVQPQNRGPALLAKTAPLRATSRPRLPWLSRGPNWSCFWAPSPARPKPGTAGSSPDSQCARRPYSWCAGFGKKPQPDLANELLGRGCLWNSFVMVGRLSAFLGLFMMALRSLYVAFRQVQPIFAAVFEKARVEKLYGDLKSANFSDDVLARHAPNLAVLPVKGVKWSDLGEPRRVMEAYARIGVRPGWAVA
jgi:mannose-1-phosphate guanylyltransferase